MDPFSSILPSPIHEMILRKIPLKNFPLLRCVRRNWRNVLNVPLVWQGILNSLTVPDFRWLSGKKLSALVLKEMYQCPQFKVACFIADSINKEVFLTPCINLEENLISFLTDHKILVLSINTLNNPERTKAFDNFLSNICVRLKCLTNPADKRWTLPQVLLRNGLECSFLTIIGLIEDKDFKKIDDIGYDLLYWAIFKNCKTVVQTLLDRGFVINSSHVFAATASADMDQLSFILEKGKCSLSNKDLFEICKRLIEHHNTEFGVMRFLIAYCKEKFTDVQFNTLAEVAYKAQSIRMTNLLIRQYQAKINFIEMLIAFHSSVYPYHEQDELDNLLYDFLKNNSERLHEYIHLRLVYYLASLGAIKTFAFIFPRLHLNNQFIPGERTPLHAACAHMHIVFARALIKQRDGKCDDRDEKGNTPWHLAFEGYKEIDARVISFIKMLLEERANIHEKNHEGHSILDVAQMSLGNHVLQYFPAYHEVFIEITSAAQFSAPLWIVMPRMVHLKSFTAQKKNWYVKSCTESDDAFQLQDMTNVNRHSWSLPSVNEVNVAKGKFYAYSWVHLFKSFPKATLIDFSFCRFTTYDPFQDQIRFLESFFKEMKREKCRINLNEATFHDKPIILTPKQLEIFKEKFPWLTIDGNVQSYQYTKVTREEARQELMKESVPAGSFRLHPSKIKDSSGQISCDEVTFKNHSGVICNHLVRIHPNEDFLLHYRRVGNRYDNVDVYPNIFVFLSCHRLLPSNLT